jgi:homoserine acetyltransferase
MTRRLGVVCVFFVFLCAGEAVRGQAQARLKFPEFTIRDMVESEYRLATGVLGLTHVRAVVGVSMGGMQAFEWAVAHPDFIDVVIPMMGSPQSTSYDKLLWTSQIDALELDPAWRDGKGTKPMVVGFDVFSEIGSMANSSPVFRVARPSRRSSRRSSPRREVRKRQMRQERAM